jgi:hypothetical protein
LVRPVMLCIDGKVSMPRLFNLFKLFIYSS